MEAHPPGTLGDVLYADKSKTPPSESDWVGLVQSIAAGNQLALHALYERTHRVVFTLAMRITNHRATAEEGTLDVFYDIWRRARRYDPENGTVVGWIMNQARSRVIDRLRFEQRNKAPTPDERRAIEAPPEASLQRRLARSIAAETGRESVLPATRQWLEPEWEQVAPGISCKVLARDTQKHRVSMLVRLAPGTDYPPHSHAGVEELHLLDGELWIDDRKLYPGDYNRAEPGTADKRVWSETGCTCVLITSTKDILR
jgi:RNA polymerase sigma factor (sigma-70 family)